MSRPSLSDFVPMWLLSSQAFLRAMIIGISLCVIHTAGVLLTVYLILTQLVDPVDSSESPYLKICTSALACPMYSLGSGLTGTTIQLLTSIAGLILNLTLVLGIVHSVSAALFLWLVSVNTTCTSH